VERGESEQAEMGRLKTVHQTRLQLPSGIKDLPGAAGCQKSQTGPKSVESKETRLF